MTRERYQELLERLLDSELSPAEATELAQGLRAHPALLNDLRQHLTLWEAWAQHVAQERSAESFVAAWKTRVNAEAGAEQFSQSVMEEIRASATEFKSRVAFWKRWRPVHLAFAILALAFLAVAGWWASQLITQPALPPPPELPALPAETNQPVTIVGQGACVWCVLHQGPPQRPALRVRQGGVIRIIYLEFPGYRRAMHPFFVKGATVTATGVLKEERNRLVLKTQSIEVRGVQYR
jgi:hypothetical protein